MLNTLKVGLLMTLMTTLFVGGGYLLGRTSGMFTAFLFAIVMNVGSYWFSDKIILRMSGAQAVGPNEAPELFKLTRDLCERANLPMPRLYIINDPQPNAFATGRNPQNAAVAINSGLLSLLNTREIEGVIAHELAHVKHRDTLTMTVVATLAGAFMVLVDMARWGAMLGGGRDDEGTNPAAFFALLFLGPMAAMMIQSAVSRAREFEADAMAARLTGSPDGLINGLLKLEQGSRLIPTHSMAPQTAHLCIVNPFRGIGGLLTGLFSTHPPVEKRVEALEALRPQMQPHNSSPWG